MRYPLDQEKWTRVRAMMEKNDLDALVVRAPDNILYLTDYWTMKGYDIAIFPREGDPTLSASSSRNSTKRSAPPGTKTSALSVSTIRRIRARR